jgi:hypothetical protein
VHPDGGYPVCLEPSKVRGQNFQTWEHQPFIRDLVRESVDQVRRTGAHYERVFLSPYPPGQMRRIVCRPGRRAGDVTLRVFTALALAPTGTEDAGGGA